MCTALQWPLAIVQHDRGRILGVYSILYPPRILRICIKLHMGYTTIIAAYAPTEPRITTIEAATEAEALYTLLKATVSKAPKKDRIIIVGISKAVMEQTLSNGAVSSAISDPENRIPTSSDYLTSVPLPPSPPHHGLLISKTWISTSRSISSPGSQMETEPG